MPVEAITFPPIPWVKVETSLSRCPSFWNLSKKKMSILGRKNTSNLKTHYMYRPSVDHGSNRGGSPRFLGKNYHTPPNFLKLRSQLSIWIIMPHRSDVYEKVAVRLEESPPSLRFAIPPILVVSRSKTCLKSQFFVRFRLRRNGHWPHWNSENGRGIYGWFCIIFVYITLFWD